ncbi:transposase [Brevibacterium aurantiacum]|uniref:transposase n=1 Tax=Brevibacterium aurantiacum TaxID=273384 RepID=UPI0013DE7041
MRVPPGHASQPRRFVEKLIGTCPSYSFLDIARFKKTLLLWRSAFLTYFGTGRASNGGTEEINETIEFGRLIAQGFRKFEHYRLKMHLFTGQL